MEKDNYSSDNYDSSFEFYSNNSSEFLFSSSSQMIFKWLLMKLKQSGRNVKTGKQFAIWKQICCQVLQILQHKI